jgi:hypothetical protein
MEFIEIEKILGKKDLTNELISNYKNGKKINLSSSDKKKVQGYIEYNAFKTRFIATLNYIVLGLIYDKKATLETIRRKGILRYSKYLKMKNFPEPLSKRIICLSTDLKLLNNEQSYFNSIYNFAPAYRIMEEQKQLIVSGIKHFSKRPKRNGFSPSIIKTLLAALDLLFLTNYYPPERENPNSLTFYIKEDIAEAVSLIIYLKHEIFGFQSSDSYLVDEDYIVSNELENILLPACHFKALQEFEIMIDHYSYICIREKNILSIIPPYPELEKSIRIGYVRTELQEQYDFKELKHIASFEEICDKFMKIPKIHVFKYTEENNYPRYRIEILVSCL